MRAAGDEALVREHPEAYWIPDRAVREGLVPEQPVMLVFWTRTVDEQGVQARMSSGCGFQSLSVLGGVFAGWLDNQLRCRCRGTELRVTFHRLVSWRGQ